MKTVIAILLAGFLLSACKPESECFDKELYEKYKSMYCTADCPGVEGCDGKFYCNECEAAKAGMRIKR